MAVVACVALAACEPHSTPAAVPPGPRPDLVAEAAPEHGPTVVPGLRLPDAAAPLAYDVRLEVDPDASTFRGVVTIRTRIVQASDVVWLHAVDLEIARATITAGTQITTAIPTTRTPDQMIGLQIGRRIVPGEITITIEYTGQTSRDQEGLFRQKLGGRWFLYSQSQSAFARRIVPCFDEPRFKVPWRVTLVVPADQVALGNAPVTSEKLLGDGRREVVLAELGPMPSYLLAIAVGPFTLVDAGTVGRSKTPVRVAVWSSDASRVALAIKLLPKVVAAFERYLDQPLPWPKLDLVAVPQFFGAMENIGLVTFEGSILIGDDSDPDFVPRLVRIVAHEVAHQWMGNLVTPAWWDDLWLSEAFATFLGEKITAELGAFDDAVLRTQLERHDALAADAGLAKRALRRPIAASSEADDMFDEIAYQKGGAVLEMFEHAAGADRFRSVVRAYVTRYANRSVTTESFVEALAAGTDRELGAALASYVTHDGTPVVELTLACGNGAPTIRAHARGGVQIPVCVRYPGSAGATRACTLAGDRAEIVLAATTCPSWLVGNEDGTGYYQTAGPASQLVPPVRVMTAAERLAVGDDIAGGLRRGELPIGDALRILRAFATSRDGYAQLAALAIAREIDGLVDAATRPRWTAWLASQLRDRLGMAALFSPRLPIDEAIRDVVLEMIPEHADRNARQRARSILVAELGRPDESGASQAAIAIAAPHDAALFDRILKLAGATKILEVKEALLEQLGELGPALAPRLVDAALDPRFPTPAITIALVRALSRPTTRTAAWQAIRDRFPALLSRLSGLEARMLVDALSFQCDPDARREVLATVEPRVADVFDGTKALLAVTMQIERCSARRAAVGDVSAALAP